MSNNISELYAISGCDYGMNKVLSLFYYPKLVKQLKGGLIELTKRRKIKIKQE